MVIRLIKAAKKTHEVIEGVKLVKKIGKKLVKKRKKRKNCK